MKKIMKKNKAIFLDFSFDDLIVVTITYITIILALFFLLFLKQKVKGLIFISTSEKYVFLLVTD